MNVPVGSSISLLLSKLVIVLCILIHLFSCLTIFKAGLIMTGLTCNAENRGKDLEIRGLEIRF